MKLKYYMRGLGLGIILTTLILTISGNTQEKLSDKEIKVRAAALGMVEEDNSDLHKILDGNKPSGTDQATGAPGASPSLEPTQTAAAEPTILPTKEPTPKPSVTPIPTLTPTPTPVPTPIPVVNNNQDADKKISFTIKRGMSSGQVATLLVQKGLIEDADDFNKYIIKKDKESTIRVGTYSLPQTATYDDIVKIITTRVE